MSVPRSPLARLVLFMVCLSIAGSIVAGLHYNAVDLPRQNALQAPSNAWYTCQPYDCECQVHRCQSNCASDGNCMLECYLTLSTNCPRL